MRKILLICIFSAIALASYGQSGRLVHGCVFGRGKAPLEGAVISTIQGEQICVTDASGQFKASTKAYVTQIKVSYNGCAPQIVNVDGSYMIITLRVNSPTPSSRLKVAEIKKGYQQEVSIGHSCDFESFMLGLNYIGGWRVSHKFFIGLGTGLDFTLNSYNPMALLYHYSDDTDTFCVFYNLDSYDHSGSVRIDYEEEYYYGTPAQTVTVPLYLHIRAYFLKSRWSPFLSFSGGARFSTPKKLEVYNCKKGSGWRSSYEYYDITYKRTVKYGAVTGMFELMLGLNYQHSKKLAFNLQGGMATNIGYGLYYRDYAEDGFVRGVSLGYTLRFGIAF